MLRLALACVVLVPVALAQASVGTVTLRVEPFAHPVVPLKGPTTTNFTVTWPCASTATVTVVEQPAWAQVVVSPTILSAPVPCVGEANLSGALSVTASDQAPARMPANVTLEASWQGQTARATAPLAAGFFSIVDTQLASTITVRPGEAAHVPLKLTNLGNAAVRVNVTPSDVATGYRASSSADIILGSKQQGAAEITRSVLLDVATPATFGYANHVGTVTWTVESFDAQDGAAGDVAHVSLVVRAQGLSVPLGLATPVAALALGALTWKKRG